MSIIYMGSYEQITNQIIQNLEKANSWSDMINSRAPINITGRSYKGINVMLLYNMDFKSRIWGTFRQVIKHGGRIRKGEKSSIVAFWSKYLPKQEGEEPPQEKWYLKVYRVFNVDQCEFIEDNQYLDYLEGKLNEEPIPAVPQEVVDDYLQRESIRLHIVDKVSVPYYTPKDDLISITDHQHYESNDEYFQTLYHECIHSTGHPNRLNRFEVGKHIYGSRDYSFEELVAEIGATFLSKETGINPDFMNSVAYVKHWIPELKKHPKWIVSAAAKAETAVEFILNRNQS